jgi:YnbE-like lipoprotein
MNSCELTRGHPAATTALMRKFHEMAGSGRRAVRAYMMLVAGSLALSGCISVAAPDKPIVIELNINIKQEVIYRLSADAANTIDEHKEIF